MPFFSIIIPTYNRAHIIRRPIESIIAQTFIDWELIIVDDGSTDETRSIVDSYSDSRIKYIWQENQERSSARNHGIKLAKGEWICFQDSDDEYLPEHLQVLNEGIQTHPEYKVFRTGLFIFDDGKYIGKSGIQAINKYDQYPYECIHSYCFRDEILLKEKFNPTLFIGEDLNFLIRIGKIQPVFQIIEWTGIHNYDAKSSGGIGPKYEINLNNKILGLDEILSWHEIPIRYYLTRQRCLAEILLLFGHFKYNSNKILMGITRNFQCFSRFPKEYTKLIIRIIYVKITEWLGFNHSTGRF